MGNKIVELLDDLVIFFEARNDGNITNEFLNRCKEQKAKQLNLRKVMQQSEQLKEKESPTFEEWLHKQTIITTADGTFINGYKLKKGESFHLIYNRIAINL